MICAKAETGIKCSNQKIYRKETQKKYFHRMIKKSDFNKKILLMTASMGYTAFKNIIDIIKKIKNWF